MNSLPTSPSKQTLLITGASGFLGGHLCYLAVEKWQVFGTFHSQEVSIPHVTMLQADLTQASVVQTLFEKIRPDAVIHAAAHAQPNDCQFHPDESYRINVGATVHLVQECAHRQIPFVFTSTDLVFDGLRNTPYREEDPVSPVNIYGQQKVEAEKKIQRMYPQAIICRLPLMFGLPHPGGKTFLPLMLTAMKQGKELRLFVDEFRTPTSVNSVAVGILLILEKNTAGIFHLGGKKSLSRYEFGKTVAKIFRLEETSLIPCLQKDVPLSAPRSLNVSLNSDKAYSLGYQPESMENALKEMKRCYENQHSF